MSTFGWIITILGFLATIIGSFLAIITYISPSLRLKFYIKRYKKWHEVYIGRIQYQWQYKNHPEFIIELDDDCKNWESKENWMNYYPDPSKCTTLVFVKVNGQIIFTEDFILLDGGRYFVPLPKRKVMSEKEKDSKYWYTQLQVDLAHIMGRFYREKNIEEFMNNHHLEIK